LLQHRQDIFYVFTGMNRPEELEKGCDLLLETLEEVGKEER